MQYIQTSKIISRKLVICIEVICMYKSHFISVVTYNGGRDKKNVVCVGLGMFEAIRVARSEYRLATFLLSRKRVAQLKKK